MAIENKANLFIFSFTGNETEKVAGSCFGSLEDLTYKMNAADVKVGVCSPPPKQNGQQDKETAEEEGKLR